MSNIENRYIINQPSLETNHNGTGELMKFFQYAYQFSYTTVILDFSLTNHVDANLSALILALATKLHNDRKVRVFLDLGIGKNVFFRNGLISHLKGNGNINEYGDDRESTIPLTAFNPNEDEEYCKYFRTKFFGHRGLDNLSNNVKNTMITHYLEVYTNVGIHANTTLPVYTCGQYFPDKNVLKFTLIDLGDGFLKKIQMATNGQVSNDRSAIIWATEGINSTKDINVFGPGGTGLKELRNYCNANNGSLHICSGSGYVNMLNNKTMEYTLPVPFPGSIINVIMRNI